MNKLIIVLLILFLWACQERYDRSLSEQIDDQCQAEKQECIFDLSQTTDFEWDKVYVFYGLADKEEISSVIGFDCQCNDLQDQRTRLVYTSNRSIVKEYEYSTLGELLQFRTLKKGDEYISYSRDEAKFYAIKKKGVLTTEEYYDLFPIKGERLP